MREDIFSFSMALRVSREDKTEERDPIENENANTPMHIRMMHITRSFELLPDISPNPTVVTVVRTKYTEAT